MTKFVIARPFGHDGFKKFVTIYAETKKQAIAEAAYLYCKKFELGDLYKPLNPFSKKTKRDDVKKLLSVL